MLDRCCNARHRQWAYYGGRGITVCKRWHKFENFRDDMGEHPGKGWTLDRWPDNDCNYEPTNCRWATYTMQNRNRRGNKISDAIATDIRQRYIAGTGFHRRGNAVLLAREFGISQGYVREIANGAYRI